MCICEMCPYVVLYLWTEDIAAHLSPELADLTVCQPVVAFIREIRTAQGFPSAKLCRWFGGAVVAEGCVKSPSVSCAPFYNIAIY